MNVDFVYPQSEEMRKGQLENDQSQVSASAYSFEIGGQEI